MNGYEEWGRMQTDLTNMSLLPEVHGGCLSYCKRRTRSTLWFVDCFALLRLEDGKELS